jgi:hypothetical protein
MRGDLQSAGGTLKTWADMKLFRNCSASQGAAEIHPA